MNTERLLKNRIRELEEKLKNYEQFYSVEKLGQTLALSEEQYRAAFETTGNATMVISEDGTVRRVNREFERIFGYLREDVEGKCHFKNFIAPDHMDMIVEYHKIRRTDPALAPQKYETRIRGANGKYKNVIVSVNMIEGTKDSIVSCTDVTELREKETAVRNSEMRYRHLVEAMNEALIMTDSNFSVMYANKKALEMLGFSEKEIFGKPVLSFVHPDSKNFVQIQMDLRKKERTAQYECMLQEKNGKILHTIVSITGNYDAFGELEGCIAVFTDISQRKTAETRLQFKMQFEELIANISARFISITVDEIDAEILKALEEIGKFAGVDHSYVLLFSENEKNVNSVYEWYTGVLGPKCNEIRKAQIDTFLWYRKKAQEDRLICIEDMEKLPPEAASEREYFLSRNVKSLLAVPLFHSERVLGVFGFDTVMERKQWSEDLIALARMLTEVFSNAIIRKQTDSELKKRIIYEEMLAEIAAQAITVSNPDSYMNHCVNILGSRLDVSTVFVIKYDKETDILTNISEWRAADAYIPDEIPGFQKPVSDTGMAGFMKLLEKNIVVEHDNTETMIDEKSRKLMTDLGVKSILMVPMFVDSVFYGIIGISNLKAHRIWREEDKNILKTVSFVMGSVIERKKRMDTISQHAEQLEKRLSVEKMLAEISAEAILADNKEEFKRKCLETVGKKFDYPYVELEDHDINEENGEVTLGVKNTICWINPAYEPPPHEEHPPPKVVHSEMGMLADALTKFHCMAYENIEDFPGEALKQMLRKHNIKSIMATPVFLYKKLYGHLTVIEHRFQRAWSEDDINTLKTVSFIISSFIEREKAEENLINQKEQLVQADKMAALGSLVSGVAHEINNPNNYIRLNSSMLIEIWDCLLPILDEYHKNNGDFWVAGLSYSRMRDKIPVLCRGMLDGSLRIMNIVNDLKNFARKDAPGQTEININNVVEKAVSLLSNQIKKCTDCFSVEYDVSIPLITGNFQRLEQVVINLVQNSCYALSSKENQVSINTAYDAVRNTAAIIIKDEGCGISADVLPRITDPFFTTRRANGGTGLGLSISDNIVKEHGGRMEFNSSPGIGTSVTITLPIRKKNNEEVI